jgi:6-phosphogluconate dehydrogenase
MHIGLVGLGRMGADMCARLRQGRVDVTAFDSDPGVSEVTDLTSLVRSLPGTPRVVWVMVPAGEPTKAVIAELEGLLREGDIVVDGGNSRYTDDAAHADQLGRVGVHFMDVGVSGGVWGLANGYGLMVGGSPEDVEVCMPVFDALRPDGPRDEGLVHAGQVGAGHFAKMVHNGIEYGLMQAYAEGYELLSASELVTDVPATFKAWSRGTVVRSWLLDLLVAALEDDPELRSIDGWVEDSGEGRWTVETALDHAVPLPVISAALFARFASRERGSPAAKVVAALRQQFGGHPTCPAGSP